MPARQLDADQTALLAEFLQARSAATAWTAKQKELRERIDQEMGGVLAAEGGLADGDGVHVGSIKIVPGRRFDQKKFRSEQPAMYAEYEVETSQARIEGPK